MKKSILLLTLVLVSGFTLLSQSPPAEVLGVWKYQLENQERMSIVTPTHFIWVITAKNRSDLQEENPSLAEKIKAYDAMNVAAGTVTYLDNKKIKFTYTHHSIPQFVGTSFEWTYEKEGDFLQFWIIQDDGSKGPQMQSKKLSDWEVSEDCSEFNGVWTYEEWNGLYIQCRNYGLWLINSQPMDKVTTDEEKATAFDRIGGSAAISDCLGAHRGVWIVIHDSDIRYEKVAIGLVTEVLSPDRLKCYRLKANGQASDVIWHLKRFN